MDEKTRKIVEVFNSGGIVIFPTDTAYGIGCRIDDEKAVKRLFEIRRRSETKAVPVLISGIEMGREYLQEIPELVVEKLIKPYWPGSLTIILQSRIQRVPSLVRGRGNTLGVRMPDHTDLRKIIQDVGVPILAPSANFAGEPTPYKFEDLDPELVKLVDYVMPARNDNAADAGGPSTVIDCTVNPWKVLRQGAVKLEF